MSTRVYKQKFIGKTERVVLTGEHTTSPLIHRIVDYSDLDEPITACDRVVNQYEPILRSDHAHMIGRRCKRCFRDF